MSQPLSAPAVVAGQGPSGTADKSDDPSGWDGRADPDHVDRWHRGPSLHTQVPEAVRLGWYLAETRGRNWWQGPRPTSEPLPTDPAHALPLRPQRTAPESRRQALEGLLLLSDRLDVRRPLPVDDTAGDSSFAVRLTELMAALDAVLLAQPPSGGGVDPADRDRAWDDVATLLYQWDSAIQDQLTAREDILACAYLLGRGLAETYWALAPQLAQRSADGLTPSACSWEFLFDSARQHELSRMAGRISAYLHPLTATAVVGSLAAWRCVADDAAWRARPDAPTYLYEQLRRWYQLLALGQDPTTLVKSTSVLHGSRRTTLRLCRAFWPQLVLGALSVAAVAAFVLLLTTEHGNPVVKSLLAIVATVGVSASTVVAKANSATQSLLARLRQGAYSDLVAIEVTTVPPHPSDDRNPALDARSRGHLIVERAVTAPRAVTLTPPGNSLTGTVVTAAAGLSR